MTRIVPSQVVETIERLFTGEAKGVGQLASTTNVFFICKGLSICFDNYLSRQSRNQ